MHSWEKRGVIEEAPDVEGSKLLLSLFSCHILYSIVIKTEYQQSKKIFSDVEDQIQLQPQSILRKAWQK